MPLAGLLLFYCVSFELVIVFPAKVIFRAFLWGHISMHLVQSMHLESVTSPPFLVYMSVACVGQARLHMPHLVHFCSSFCSFVRAIFLKGHVVLKRAVSAPTAHMRHQMRRYARERIITIIRTVRLMLE